MKSENRTGSPDERESLSRRSFLKGAGGAAAGSMFARGIAEAEQVAEAEPEQADAPTLEGNLEVTLQINGEDRVVQVEPRTTLLSALRHRLDPALTGAKQVCDNGNCGACTVMFDGRPVYSCMQLACLSEGKQITTVEGLGSPDAMSDVQAAFCEKDALMCGFCTPGFVVASTACLDRYSDADLDTIREQLAGNLCRCGTYPHIFEALESVRESRRAAGAMPEKTEEGQ